MTTLVSWYQNVSILAFLKAKDDGGGDEGLHEQIKTLLFKGQILFLSPNQQCQSNEGVKHHIPWTCSSQVYMGSSNLVFDY